jgi:hypothetical protein
VAIAILHDKPERDPEEVLREVKRSVLNLRLEYRDNVERALRENLAMQEERAEKDGEATPLETRLKAFELTPTPEPQDYLMDNEEVVTYLFKGELPGFANLSTKKRKEARRQIRDRAKKFCIDNGRLFFLDKPPKRPNQVPGVVQKKVVLTRMEKEAVLRSVHDNGGQHTEVDTGPLLVGRDAQPNWKLCPLLPQLPDDQPTDDSSNGWEDAYEHGGGHAIGEGRIRPSRTITPH